MAKIQIVAHVMTPHLTAAVARLAADTHQVSTLDFGLADTLAEGHDWDADVFVAVPDLADLDAVKALLASNKPVVCVCDSPHTMRACEQAGVAWVVPDHGALGSELSDLCLHGRECGCDEPVFDEIPRIVFEGYARH